MGSSISRSGRRSVDALVRHRWRALRADQLGPDEVPVTPQVPATQLAACRRLDARSLFRVHVPAPRQALVEVLVVHAGRSGELAALGGGDVLHGPQSSLWLAVVKRSARSWL